MQPHLTPESAALAAASLAASRAASAAVGRPRCPHCAGGVSRMPRSTLDRLISLVVPVRHYRCRALACAWEGPLRDSLFRLHSSDDSKRYITRLDG